VKSWRRAVAAAFLFAMVMAAAQVGAASILGILRLDGSFAEADAWTAQLTLLCWFAITAVVAGAYAGGRTAGSGTRLSAALAAGLGSMLGASLALYPARTAALPHGDGLLTAGIAVGFAAIGGLILAFGLISARSLGWNAAVVGLLVWGLLAVAIITHPATAQLGQLDAPQLSPSFVHSFRLWGLPAAVALLSMLTAVIARLRGHHRLAVAFSGLGGAATIALAYAVAGPGTTDAQKIPWTSALAAVVAGLAASLVVALPPRRTPKRAVEPATSDPAFPLPPAPTLSDIPLPRRRGFADLDDRSFAQ
jgi:hypothetical protein